ncbi:MAG: amidohydrolase family protein, partial [Chloroflexi bacterium]|nr:amidohydrolase family protein [Chloroflexota bacterium]
MPVIDFHTHLFPASVRDSRERYLHTDPAFRALYENGTAKLASPEEIVRTMDEAGIDISVACGFGWSTPDLCKAGNDAIIDAVNRYPTRIIGFGTIAPAAGLDAAVFELRRLAAAGIRGIGELRPDTQGLFDMASADFVALAAEIASHRLAVLLHTS